MFLRSAPTETVESLLDSISDNSEALSVTGSNIRVDHVAGSIDVGGREVPLTEDGLVAIGNWLQIPTPFLKRVDNDLREHMLNTMLHRSPHNTVVTVNDSGIRKLRSPNNKDVEPQRLVHVAASVVGRDAVVVDFENSLDSFRFDVVVGDNADYGIGGDRHVGDVTKGGLRFGMDMKRNLAPWVQPYSYRLICTNGMEMRDDGLRIDSRGNTVDEVIAELEAAAQRAFSRVESDIAHFYDLRNERVVNPERTLARMASERNLADRTTVRLIERLPTILDEDGSTNMFEMINLITNTANDPSVRRWGTRRELESFGGHVVGDHVERCGACSSRLQ